LRHGGLAALVTPTWPVSRRSRAWRTRWIGAPAPSWLTSSWTFTREHGSKNVRSADARPLPSHPRPFRLLDSSFVRRPGTQACSPVQLGAGLRVRKGAAGTCDKDRTVAGSVAVCASRASCIGAVTIHLLVHGSYSSALERICKALPCALPRGPPHWRAGWPCARLGRRACER
jgi:hypothetical protein